MVDLRFHKPGLLYLSLLTIIGGGSAIGSEADSIASKVASTAAAGDDEWKSKVIHSIATVSTRNVSKVPKVEFPWGSIAWLMNSEIDPEAKMTYGVVRIEAGKSNPLHIHPNCEEYLYVLSGSCEHVLADKTVILKPGDVIRIPVNVPHKARALGEAPCDAVIVYDTGTREVILLETGEE